MFRRKSSIARQLRQAAKAALWTVAPAYMERRVVRNQPEIIAGLDRYRAIFIHIPKNAGLSIGRFMFGEIARGHLTWRECQLIDPARFAKYLKFAVVREPIDRFLSAYDYQRRMHARKNMLSSPPEDDVNAFIRRLGTPRYVAPSDGLEHVFWGQAAFVLNRERRAMVNRLVPFERLQEFVPEFLGIAPAELPRRNVTGGVRTAPAALSAQSLNTLRTIYRVDFALHRYALDHAGEDVFKHVLPLFSP